VPPHRIEHDQHVDVGVLVCLAARHRSEEAKLAQPSRKAIRQPLLQFRECAADERWDLAIDSHPHSIAARSARRDPASITLDRRSLGGEGRGPNPGQEARRDPRRIA
jgi:hypothetical protein